MDLEKNIDVEAPLVYFKITFISPFLKKEKHFPKAILPPILSKLLSHQPITIASLTIYIILCSLISVFFFPKILKKHAHIMHSTQNNCFLKVI